MPLAVAAFYKFVALPDAPRLREPLLGLCRDLALSGTVLLADEGINGTVAGPAAGIDELVAALRQGPLFAGRLDDLDVRRSYAATNPFGRIKVRLKREIVTLGSPADPAARTGTPVPAADWDRLMERADVTVIDTRNAFEVAMGTFPGALDPKLDRFGAFPSFVTRHLDPARDRTVAMFCTGGIRCAKASAFLLERGFDTVYQLDGGILRYLETIPAAASRWRGACFVFDGRVALGPGLAAVAEASDG